MTRPKPVNARSEFVKAHMRQFEEKHIKPARERVQAKPYTLDQEGYKLFDAAKPFFKSQARGCPGNKEALCLFALERLEDLVNDQDIAEKVIGHWVERGSQVFLANLILYPLNPWPKDTWCWSNDGQNYVHGPVTQPGFLDYARSVARSSSYTYAQPESPPPPSRDPLELDLETKVLRAEEELERHRAALKTYREAKEKAAQEQAERARVARERAEQEARDRMARERAERERVEREARERAERERRAREQSAHQTQSPPQWALILELTPPYSEDQVRIAYRRKSKLTHPDLGGTAKEFREVDSAYDSAMAYCRSLRA